MVSRTLGTAAPISKPAMKLLVFAHPPPPVHGQSLMVRTLLDGLPGAAPGLEVHCVAPRLSRDAADIGRPRPGKLIPLLGACLRALRLRVRHGPMVFYYVPAPGRRAALYRDWVVLLLCRPFFHALVLHWHAVGLGGWLAAHATPPERWLTRALLGRADLALVLAPELADDARALAPRRVAVVPNGLADPSSAARPEPAAPAPDDPAAPFELLFLGLGSREKGLFVTLEALALALAREPGGYRLTVAGGFASPGDERAFHARAAALGPGAVRHVGFADEARKRALFATAGLFCFPTAYPHEGQPLVLLEALAHDVPIVTTRWRGIPGLLPAGGGHFWFVDAGDPAQLALVFHAARRAGPAGGALRRHYLAHFTADRHLAVLAAALRSVDVS